MAKNQQNQHRSTHELIKQVSVMAMANIFIGYSSTQTNTAQPTLNVYFGIDEDSKALFESCCASLFLFGGILGTMLVIFYPQLTSIRNLFMILDGLCMVSCLFTITPSIILFMIGRIIQGFASGLISVYVPIYVKQISPVYLNTLLSSVYCTIQPFGNFLSYMVGYGYSDNPSKDDMFWKFAFMFPFVNSAIRLYFLITIYKNQPPIYYIENNDEAKAIEVLNHVYQQKYVPQMIQNLKYQKKESQKEGEMSIKDILGPKYRWRIIIGVMGLTTQQFTGINAVFFFSNKIFLLATQNNVLISTILTNFVGAIVVGMGFLIGKVVNMYGRRSIMIFGCVSSIVCMTLIGYFSGDLEKDPTDSESAVITIVVIYIFLALFAVSLGPVPWMVNAEILPPKGCAICTFFCWLAGYLVGQTFPLFLEQFGSAVAFYMFVVLTILNLIFIFKYFPETSGLTKEQIDKYFDDIDQSTTKKGSKQQPLIDIKIINDKQQNQQSQQ